MNCQAAGEGTWSAKADRKDRTFHQGCKNSQKLLTIHLFAILATA